MADAKAQSEEQEAEERSAPSARVVYDAVSKQGEDELNRPVSSLFWSGFAAGVAIMASVSASGALHHYLPEAPWREAVTSLGYPLGFLIVILGRLQLFTEHTTVAVLPLARRPSAGLALQVARLWAAVFVANVVGAATVAALAVFGRVQAAAILDGMVAVSAKLLERTPIETLMQAIPAGFLVASIAWIRSATEGSGFWVVLAITYGIALCGFAHVVAGAAEAFVLLWHGEAGLGWTLGGFLLPALLGNIIGGTGLFALLAHAQVKDEIDG
ncbi:formate/nitrite transporter family protein [Sphingomonas psychrotolerans]|uniref:Formate/nitrite transporter family protein n=1 Tax=Sphingomonas psychrotolerans TaxID=1327635 RepID=A0ABU3MY33_9SPHN|nr:formate/nitrite transporter family protein [Sphingomonas psychrotolerans]MDT8757128.1 formate/nitrite transporter family protein [Sphingomonas psychrotolerans]